MKKEYIAPQVEVIEMKCEAKLAYTSASLNAREFEFDDDEDM
jgi:hypothetical protein